MHFTSADLNAAIASFLLPFVRIGAMFALAPVFGAQSTPMRVRLLLALAVTAVLVPVLPAAPAVDPLSARGVLLLAQQFVIGLAMGFVLQMVLGAVTLAGQAIAMSMGLGFASMVDPQNGVQVPVLGQYFLILTTLLFLVLNGHLVVIEVLAASFQTLPLDGGGLAREGLWGVAGWATQMFAGAILIALPVMISLMTVNMGFGVMMRAAPQLNIFAVGFPVTMVVGFVLIIITLPSIAEQIQSLFDNAFSFTRALGRGGP